MSIVTPRFFPTCRLSLVACLAAIGVALSAPPADQMPTSSPGGMKIDLQRLNAEYRNAVVMVEFTLVRNLSETKLDPGKSERYAGSDAEGAHGSGFFVNDSEIVTNAHVVEEARRGSIWIKSPATGNVKFKVEVVGIGNSSTIDLAVLRMPRDEQMRFRKQSGAKAIRCLTLGSSDSLKQSDAVAIMGYPTNSDELKVIQAEVTGRQYQHFRSADFFFNYQFIEVGPGGVVQPGNSGGPALDHNGLVVGIPTLGDYRGNQGWLIPVSIARSFLDRIRNDQAGKVPLDIPELGVELARNSPGNLVLAGAPEDLAIFELGVAVREVHPRSTAEKWGLKSGDMIVGFANKQKRISCALDFGGYRVVTGSMARWPQGKTGTSNLNAAKLHLVEMVFTSNVGDEITLWYVRPRQYDAKSTGDSLRSMTNKIDADQKRILPHLALYEKPEYEYWGDFVAQDFNDYNVDVFNVPITEILKGGVLVTYVEPNSLASHNGFQLNDMSGYGHEFSSGMYSRMFGRRGKWYVIDSVNGKAVNNLAALKQALRSAESTFEATKKAAGYNAERKILYKERYVEFGVRTSSAVGEATRFATSFPIDDALECRQR